MVLLRESWEKSGLTQPVLSYYMARQLAAKATYPDLCRSKTKTAYRTATADLVRGKWSETSVDFCIPAAVGDLFADEIHLLLEAGAELLVDDLLLYVPDD